MRIAIKEFKPEISIWLDLEIILTKNNKVGQGEDGVGGKVVNPQVIEFKELAEE